MRKLLIFSSLWLGVAAGIFAADTFTLTDGTSVSGDIVSSDAVGVMIHTTADSYNNYQWTNFSQDSLKQLAANAKYRGATVPLIEPTPGDRPAPPEIPVNPVTRLKLPDHPSIFGGLTHSSVGLFILLVLYLANLYAALEISVVRGQPRGMVLGVSAVLPIAGPIIFLMQPTPPAAGEEAASEEGLPGEPASPGAPPPGGVAAGGARAGGPAARSGDAAPEDIQIVSASWQPSSEEKKPQPQVFARGKFTLNKRFIETRFAGFIGEPKGEATTFTMQIRTLKETVDVECIKQTGATEAIVETPNGQITLAYGDIQEIKLTPKPA